MRNLCFTIFLFVMIVSCSQERIEELKNENKQLEQKVSSLEYEKESLEREIAEMRQDMYAILDYAGRARTNASEAAFWANNGDSFLFQTNLRGMSSNFNEIVNIASKY